MATDIYEQYLERKRKWIADEAFKRYVEPINNITMYDIISNYYYLVNRQKLMTESYALIRQNFEEYKDKVNEKYSYKPNRAERRRMKRAK